jgi:hypothetical protein
VANEVVFRCTFNRPAQVAIIVTEVSALGSIQEDRHKVEQFHFLWNSSTFFRSCDPEAEQLYKKVEQVLKAGHSSTKCGTATHMSVPTLRNSERMIKTSSRSAGI